MVSDEEFLSWVADRVVYVHGDHIHTDSYVVGNIYDNPDLLKKVIQIHDKVTILPSNIKWLRDRCDKEHIVHDIKEEKGRKLYKLSFIFTWVTEDQIEKVA